MHQLLKKINILLFKRKHVFRTFYMLGQSSTITDEYSKEIFATNFSIKMFIKELILNTYPNYQGGDIIVYIISSNEISNLKAFSFTLYLTNIYKANSFYKIANRRGEIQICNSFMRKYFFFKKPKYIHFNITLL